MDPVPFDICVDSRSRRQLMLLNRAARGEGRSTRRRQLMSLHSVVQHMQVHSFHRWENSSRQPGHKFGRPRICHSSACSPDRRCPGDTSFRIVYPNSRDGKDIARWLPDKWMFPHGNCTSSRSLGPTILGHSIGCSGPLSSLKRIHSFR